MTSKVEIGKIDVKEILVNLKNDTSYLKVPQLEDGVWSIKVFDKKSTFLAFLEKQIKRVGQYNLKDTYLWNEKALTHKKTGEYTRYKEGSPDYTEFWRFERLKCTTGVIINGRYITNHYYFYLNYTPIYNVVEGSQTFAEIWDSHYHYTLLKALAREKSQYTSVLKKRRWGFSYLECAELHRQFILEKFSITRLIHDDEETNKKNWEIIDSYRNWTNQHTGWFRAVRHGYPKIIQEVEIVSETEGSKKVDIKGLHSVIESVVTRQKASKGVGKYANYILYDEAGTNAKLLKSISYNEKNIKQGSVVKGFISIGGSVGELKDCEDLKKIHYSPKSYNFLGVENDFGEEEGIFVPESWNYIHAVVENGDVVGEQKYYDEDGNSDVEGAERAIIEERIRTKDILDPQTWRIKMSQAPLTAKEAFDEREENKFPTGIISNRIDRLMISPKGTPIYLYRENGVIKHKFIDDIKVYDFPVKKTTMADGCIMVYEFPLSDAPVNLYYAGIDTITKIRATAATTNSLQSCYIIRAACVKDGKLLPKAVVAEYTGRHINPNDTFDMTTLLWEWYNARPLVENNNFSYIQDLMAKKKHHRLIKSSEINNLKELTNNKQMSKADFGVSCSRREVIDYIEDCCIEFIEEEHSKEFLGEFGQEIITVRGIDTFPDIMALKEMKSWSPKINADRIRALGLGLWACKVFNELNHVKPKIVNKQEPKVERKIFSSPKMQLSRKSMLRRTF